jgi:hypothetical protein
MIGLGSLLPALRDAEQEEATTADDHAADGDDAANTNTSSSSGSSSSIRLQVQSMDAAEAEAEEEEEEEEEDSFTSVNSSLNDSNASALSSSASGSVRSSPFTAAAAAAAAAAEQQQQQDENGEGAAGPKVVPYNPSRLNPKWKASDDNDDGGASNDMNDDDSSGGSGSGSGAEFKPWEAGQQQRVQVQQQRAYPQLPCGVGCYSIPDISTLQSMTEEEKSSVHDLVIGKEGYGEVQWRDHLLTDNSNGNGNGDDDNHHLGGGGGGGGVDLSGKFVLSDEMIRWEGKPGRCTGVVLWPTDTNTDSGSNSDSYSSGSGSGAGVNGRKPRVGDGLNKEAVVTLQFRKNFRRKQMASDIRAGGMTFVDYEPTSGRLQFIVQHF